MLTKAQWLKQLGQSEVPTLQRGSLKYEVPRYSH